MGNSLRIEFFGATLLAFLGASACKNEGMAPVDMGPTVQLGAERIDVRAYVADLMRAAIEMQHSGEPLAQAMGRDLAGYDRNALNPDQYKDPKSDKIVTDLVGYSSAVESYEYSKIMMNTIAFESGPGLSLMYGPLINPNAQEGGAALELLRARIQALAIASHAGQNEKGPWVRIPAPSDNALNRLGFPGLLPEFLELESFAPDINPSGNVLRGCSFVGGYGAASAMAVAVSDYECGYNSLHIGRGAAQKTLALDGLGFAAWKQALWAINYFQLVHDGMGAAFSRVADADVSQVGVPGNAVQADNGNGTPLGTKGTYIGSNDLEGFQGMLMVEAIDNKAEFLLKNLAGFPDLVTALNYDYAAPSPRTFPSRILVEEQAASEGADPRPTRFSVKEGPTRLIDLAALIGGYAEAFALTDRRNADVGGAATTRAVFDGDPFPADNGKPDGEATLHDRALAVLKVALVNLDRLHTHRETGVLCSQSGATACEVPKTDTVELVETLVALRTAYRALSSQLSLYGNDKPDTTVTTSALDGTSLLGIPGGVGVSLATRLQTIIKVQADFLSNKLVAADGLAKNGYALDTATPQNAPTTLEAQAAAVRGLLEAYLATNQSIYRDRAEAAYAVLEQRFYDPVLRIYRTRLGDDYTFVFTPVRFATLQAALRQMYVLVGSRPGRESLGTELETRLARLNKLVLNGWDDRNGDGVVDYPAECLRVESALPRGGLLLGERALTGELGSLKGAPTADRDRDCVPEIDDAKFAALLAHEWVLVRK